jgi:hypothetical protein
MSILYIDFPNDFVIFTNINILGGFVILEIYNNNKLSGKIYKDGDSYYLVNYMLEYYLINNTIISKLEDNNGKIYLNLINISLKDWFFILVNKKKYILKNTF